MNQRIYRIKEQGGQFDIQVQTEIIKTCWLKSKTVIVWRDITIGGGARSCSSRYGCQTLHKSFKTLEKAFEAIEKFQEEYRLSQIPPVYHSVAIKS